MNSTAPSFVTINSTTGKLTISAQSVTLDTIYYFYINSLINNTTDPVKKLIKLTILNWITPNWKKWQSISSTTCDEWNDGFTKSSEGWNAPVQSTTGTSYTSNSTSKYNATSITGTTTGNQTSNPGSNQNSGKNTTTPNSTTNPTSTVSETQNLPIFALIFIIFGIAIFVNIASWVIIFLYKCLIKKLRRNNVAANNAIANRQNDEERNRINEGDVPLNNDQSGLNEHNEENKINKNKLPPIYKIKQVEETKGNSKGENIELVDIEIMLDNQIKGNTSSKEKETRGEFATLVEETKGKNSSLNKITKKKNTTVNRITARKINEEEKKINKIPTRKGELNKSKSISNNEETK